MAAEASIEIEPARVAEWLDAEEAPKLIDVREPYEREAGYIEGSEHVPMLELAGATQAQQGRRIVFYCRVGGRSRMAAEAFRTAGFDAYTMTGGLLRWAAEGRPLSPDGGRVADH